MAATRPAVVRLIGAIVLAVSGLQYLLAEAIAASAWIRPAYSYANNYISDLGVPGCPTVYSGRSICSPLSGVMTAGFIIEGMLFLAGSVVLVALGRGSARWVFLAFALCHAAGIVLVGFVNETVPASIGALSVHALGATLAIVGGNIAAIIAGFALDAPRWFRVTSVILGVVGLTSVVLLETHIGGLADGITERGSVYTITAWQIAAGVMLMLSWRTTRRAGPPPAGARTPSTRSPS